jgi:hypothetical protein
MYIGRPISFVEVFLKENPGYHRRESLEALDDDEPILNAFVIPKPYKKIEGKWSRYEHKFIIAKRSSGYHGHDVDLFIFDDL